MLRVILGVVWCWVWPDAGAAHWPTTEVQQTSKLGGQVGTSLELIIDQGANLVELDQLQLSIPGGEAKLLPPPLLPPPHESRPSNRFWLKIPADTPAGFYELRVHGRYGLSNSRRFWVTREAWRYEAWRATSPQSPGELPMNEVRQDRCHAAQRNHYQFQVVAPGLTHFHLVTASLDSRARLIGELTDAQGRRLAMFESGEQRDLVGQYEFTQAGTYQLSVYDHLYRGGEDYGYALLWQQLEPQKAPGPIKRWRSLVHDAQKRMRAGYSQQGIASSALPLLTLRPPLVKSSPTSHREGQYPGEQPCPLAWPSLAIGKFDGDGDEDWYQFQTANPISTVIEAISDRIGEPTDTLLILFRVENPGRSDERLVEVAKNDDLPLDRMPGVTELSRDSVLPVLALEPGTYRLLVRNQQHLGSRSPMSSYILECRQPNPDFQLLAQFLYPDRDASKSSLIPPTALRQSTTAISLLAYRMDGMRDVIAVTVEGLPEGLTAQPLSLPAGQNLGHVLLHAAADAPASRPTLRFRGQASLSGKVVSRSAMLAEFSRGPVDTLRRPSVQWISRGWLQVEERDRVPCRVQLGDEPLVDVLPGGAIKVPVQVHREEGGKQAMTLRFRDLPPFVKLPELKLEGEASQSEFELSIPAEAPPGLYQCWAQAETKVKLSPQAAEVNVYLPSNAFRFRIREKP
jgi:hypothetical protein